jgi:hypothetical protein
MDPDDEMDTCSFTLIVEVDCIIPETAIFAVTFPVTEDVSDMLPDTAMLSVELPDNEEVPLIDPDMDFWLIPYTAFVPY